MVVDEKDLPVPVGMVVTGIFMLSFLLVGILIILCVDYTTCLHLTPAVVSACVSSSSNGSHQTTRWDVTLDLEIPIPEDFESHHIGHVQATLSHPDNNNDLAVSSTRLFPITRIDIMNRNARGIQLRAEDDDGPFGFRFDSSSLRFRLSVQVWARVMRTYFSHRYYIAHVNGNLDWTGSSDLVGWLSPKEKDVTALPSPQLCAKRWDEVGHLSRDRIPIV